MKRYTNPALPKSHPFRTVYAAKRNGRKYRVARCTVHPGQWRLDVAELTGWESEAARSYPTRDAAIAAFNAIA